MINTYMNFYQNLNIESQLLIALLRTSTRMPFPAILCLLPNFIKLLRHRDWNLEAAIEIAYLILIPPMRRGACWATVCATVDGVVVVGRPDRLSNQGGIIVLSRVHDSDWGKIATGSKGDVHDVR